MVLVKQMYIEKSSESEPVDFEPLSEKGWYRVAPVELQSSFSNFEWCRR